MPLGFGGIASRAIGASTSSGGLLLGVNDGQISGTLTGLSGTFNATFDSESVYTPGTDFVVLDAYSLGSDFVLISGIPVFIGAIDGNVGGLSGGFVGHNNAAEGIISGVLSGIDAGQFAGEYDVNVHRYQIARTCSDVETGSALSLVTALRQDYAAPITIDVCLVSEQASPVPIVTDVVVDQNSPAHDLTCVPLGPASGLPADVHSPVEQLEPNISEWCGATDDAQPVVGAFAAAFNLLELLRISSCYPVDDTADAPQRDPTYDIIIVSPNGYTVGMDFIIEGGAFTNGLNFFLPYTTSEIVYRDLSWQGILSGLIDSPRQRATPALRHQCHPIQEARRPPPGTSIPVDPPPPPPPPPPEGHETLTIPTQSVYTMQHVITVVTLVGNVAVPMSSVSLSLSADAFAWQFSGTLLDPGALSLVEIVDNEPVKLKITIDGYIWHVIVEEIEHSRQFAKQSITLKGRSLSALLGGPYEQPGSTAYGSDLTVQQLAEMQLPVGWTLDWSQVTWLVPGGAWSFTNQTPIQALASIANDTGSMLVPARNGQSLEMMPRYPYWPWDFAGATPDLVIPEAAIKSVSLRPRLGTQANGVYVHGGDVGGVLGWCRFNGTDGARLASTVSNNLMTDVIGCRALGSRILAGQYIQPIIKSLTLPLDGVVFPLAEVGMLAAITLGAETERGIINSVGIEASLASVSQTIQIGEETPNVWALFKELLPRDPLLVGTLASTDGSTSIITLIDGGVISVRGTGTVGNKYYIRSGRIEGEAPTLTQQEIVV